MRKAYILIGASSAIAQATIAEILSIDETACILAISQNTLLSPPLTEIQKFISVPTEYTEDGINRAVETTKTRLEQHQLNIAHIIIFNGTLHNPTTMPEKQLSDLNVENMQTMFLANTTIPLLWASKLSMLLPKESASSITCFSARVGSINDNRLGGWYSYRSSKAALNMGMKTLSIELARRKPEVKILLFHPGTTDTPLSKPFQKHVPANKLFQATFVAKRLTNIIHSLKPNMGIQYLDWDGKIILW